MTLPIYKQAGGFSKKLNTGKQNHTCTECQNYLHRNYRKPTDASMSKGENVHAVETIKRNKNKPEPTLKRKPPRHKSLLRTATNPALVRARNTKTGVQNCLMKRVRYNSDGAFGADIGLCGLIIFMSLVTLYSVKMDVI
jgi:hypothetical protein